jgi:adenylate cyclase
MERRLAAVMIADVAGYSRHSQADEEGTRVRFQADLHDVFEPKIAEHHGRLVKTMGDALLVEFHSVVDALRCAVEVQRTKQESNASVPERGRLVYRIGINLGDVIVEGDDIHGDGVNIADRLQQLAEPGGIAVAGTAYDQVKAKLPIGFASLGGQRVKNIAEPVRVYRVLMDPKDIGKTVDERKAMSHLRGWPAAVAAAFVAVAVTTAWWHPWEPRPETVTAALSPLPDKPSIAVLPFNNMSADAEQGYLADGLTEDLTTELARVPGLFVISRNAAFTYKGKDITPAQVAAGLGVRYILEGSVRRLGDDMRINAQLIDAQTSGHLWAERYDGAWSDVFKLQDKMVEQIATALKLRLVEGPRAAEAAGGTSVPAAYDAYLRGLEDEYRGTPDAVGKAAGHYRQAVALDPNFGRGWARLAWLYWNAHGPEMDQTLGLKPDEFYSTIDGFMREAEKHPSPPYYQVLTDLLIHRWESQEAVAAAERAIALDPSDPDSYVQMSLALTFSGRPADGKSYLDAAYRVDPRPEDWRYVLEGLAAFAMGRFDDAIVPLVKIDSKSAPFWSRFHSRILLTATYGHLGRPDLAAALRGELDELAREAHTDPATVMMARIDLPFTTPADRHRLRDGLRKAGVPDLPYGYDPMSKDRLTGEEIRSLIFGHTSVARNIDSGRECSYTRTIDGTSSASCGSWSDTGSTPWFDDNVICYWWKKTGPLCVTYFRNPEGSAAERNEFFSVTSYNRWEFSIVE